MLRITTGSMLRSYQSQLGRSMSTLNTARTQVLTGRRFSKGAEDPAGAIREAQLERKYLKNKDHISLLGDVQSRQLVQEDSLMQVSDAMKQIAHDYSVQAITGTNGPDERQTFATAIRQFQKSMVLSMNTSYESQFVFAGADGQNPPFELSDDGRTLTYRGIDVNTKDPDEIAKLQKMAGETLFVDLGFGLTLDADEQVVSSSAFDMAIPGIKALGFGQDANGISGNAIALAGQLADELEKPEFNVERYKELMTKFQDSSSKVLNTVTELGVNSKFLSNTESRLKDEDINIQVQLKNVAGIDMAEAITGYSWSQYAYNAALKVGTSILSQSFIDFMR